MIQPPPDKALPYRQRLSLPGQLRRLLGVQTNGILHNCTSEYCIRAGICNGSSVGFVVEHFSVYLTQYWFALRPDLSNSGQSLRLKHTHHEH